MKKVNATLLYGIDEHNKYMVVKFYIMENSGEILTIINNTNDMQLAFRYESMKEMLNSMKRVLKTKNYCVSALTKNSISTCGGIICLKMYGTDFLVSNPARVL